jgi:cytochrome oxidase Cu insertion factor (SCO1/SenC/PrrC family)
MKPRRTHFLSLALVLLLSPSLEAQLQDPEVGISAPSFTLPDTEGTAHDLSDYAGKWVILEWLNYGCPFVQKHYRSGNMQALQERLTGEGMVWFSIVSSAPGKQGYYEAAEMEEVNQEHGNRATAVLLDPEGTVGMAYGARTTPQMYLIDPQGVLLYNGAIDDKPSTDVADIEGSTNYLIQALLEARDGDPVSQPTTRPYGCSVKYR